LKIKINAVDAMKERDAKNEVTTLGFEVEYERLGEKPLFPSNIGTVQLILDVGCGAKPKGTVNVDILKNGVNKQMAEQNNGKGMSVDNADNFVLADGDIIEFHI